MTHSKITTQDQIRTLAESVTHVTLDWIYLKPSLRETIHKERL